MKVVSPFQYRSHWANAFYVLITLFELPFLAVVLENLCSNDRHDIVRKKWVDLDRIGFSPFMKSVYNRDC